MDRLDTPAIPLALSWLDNYNGQYGAAMDFSQAVPDFPPPPSLLKHLSEMAESSASCGYGEIKGEPELRAAYASYLSDFYRKPMQADNVHITSGCNQAFVATLIALVASGDSILMTNPGYFNHEATARMLGIRLRSVDCQPSDAYVPGVEAIEAGLDDSVRAVALVSPNNPCGTIYSATRLKEILQLCQRRGIWLILDETYRDFILTDSSNGDPCHRLFESDLWQENFIQLYSFSKSFCIPGHRLGAITAGTQVIDAVARVMDNIQICPPRAAQLALARQLPESKNWMQSNAAEIAQRADAFKSVMQPLDNWKIKSVGAYFAYVQHPLQNQTAMTVATQLARDYGVLTLPGSFFGSGQEQFLRVAFANAPLDKIQQLGERMLIVNKRLCENQPQFEPATP